MAKSRKRPGAAGSGNAKFLFGFVTGLVLAAAGVWVYFRFQAKPAASAQKPVPSESSVFRPPVSTKAPPELKSAPFGTSEDVFEAGAHVYKAQCASCHGTSGHDVAFAKYTDPVSPQLWKKRDRSIVGVSDEPAGEIYWKVVNGVRSSGMPAYQHVLTDTQMWQVSLLLKNADQQLPDPVIAILSGAKP